MEFFGSREVLYLCGYDLANINRHIRHESIREDGLSLKHLQVDSGWHQSCANKVVPRFGNLTKPLYFHKFSLFSSVHSIPISAATIASLLKFDPRNLVHSLRL